MSEEKHTPLDQFKIQELVNFDLGGYDVSFTNSSLLMLLAVAAATFMFTFGMRKAELVPGRFQGLTELIYEFVSGIVKENMGQKGRKYFPFIFSLFTFILFTNMLGVLPYSFTSTSHIAITFTLALIVFASILIVGFGKHGLGFFKLFVPSGLPLPLVPLIAVVEFVSFLARPLSLSVRLAAAMTAGHILLKVFASFVLMLWGIEYVGPVLGLLLPMPVIVGLIGLEIFVAFLQAYIFALLASIYLHEAIELH